MTAETLTVWALGASLSATILLLLVMALRRPVANAFGARAAMLLWAAPALRLVLPPLGFGLLPVLGTAAIRAPETAAPAAMMAAPALQGGQAYVVPAVMSYPGTAPAAEPGPSLAALLPQIGLAEAALTIWLLGAAIALLFVLLECQSWRRTLLREAGRTPASVTEEAAKAAAAAGFGGRYTVILSGAAASPQVTGLLSPLVALPTDFQTRFSAQERHLALLHEFTHLERHDLAVRFAAEALCALHWFNPLLRLALPRLAADQEAACDEAVRAKGAAAKTYAATLLRAAKGPAVPALTLNHDLKRRIETMRKPLPQTPRRLLGSAAALALAVGGAAAMQEGAGSTAGQEGAGTAARQDRVVEMAGEKDVTVGVERTEKRIRMIRVGDRRQDMVLLSDPFEELTRSMPAMPEGLGELHIDVAMPPMPPMPPMPEVKTRTDEEGTWMLMPGTNDADFEARMEEFGERMEAWGERHGEAIERLNEDKMERFEVVMERFGDRMGGWGEKMGAVGEAVGELGKKCERHRERSSEPAIFTAEVEGSGEVVKAVCASGGAERYASAEISRFVRDNPALSTDEKAYFEKERRDD